MKYDCYVRGKFFATVEGANPVAALNVAHAKMGGDVSNGRLVVVRSDERGYTVTDAVNASKGIDRIEQRDAQIARGISFLND